MDVDMWLVRMVLVVEDSTFRGNASYVVVQVDNTDHLLHNLDTVNIHHYIVVDTYKLDPVMYLLVVEHYYFLLIHHLLLTLISPRCRRIHLCQLKVLTLLVEVVMVVLVMVLHRASLLVEAQVVAVEVLVVLLDLDQLALSCDHDELLSVDLQADNNLQQNKTNISSI